MSGQLSVVLGPQPFSRNWGKNVEDIWFIMLRIELLRSGVVPVWGWLKFRMALLEVVLRFMVVSSPIKGKGWDGGRWIGGSGMGTVLWG